jgi:hypothetical protein
LILTQNEIADTLRYADPADLPPAALALAPAIGQFLAAATGYDWAAESPVNAIAKQAARILLIKWFDDPGQAGRGEGVYGLTNLLGILQMAAMDKAGDA